MYNGTTELGKTENGMIVCPEMEVKSNDTYTTKLCNYSCKCKFHE